MNVLEKHYCKFTHPHTTHVCKVSSATHGKHISLCKFHASHTQ